MEHDLVAEDEKWAIAGEIRSWRRRAGLAQTELAALIGVTHRTISNWETAKTEPSAAQYRRIAERCGRIIHLNRRRFTLVA